MLNNTYNKYDNNHTSNVKINSCSGGIYKTYKESWFKKVDINDLFVLNDPQYEKGCYNLPPCYDNPVVIIQVILWGESKGIAEVMYKEDFDKYFDNNEEIENE